MRTNKFPWGILVLLLLAAVGGVAASFPFVASLYADKLANAPLPVPVIFALALLQNSILLALLIGVGLLLTAKVGLPGPPLLERWRAGESVRANLWALIHPALMTGAGVGLTVILLSTLLLRKELPQLPYGKAALIPIWKRLLLCFYGGLTEEILMRIFLLGLIAWLLSKVWRSESGRLSSQAFWTANIFLALLFGLGHLASLIPLLAITPKIVVAALLLNGLASLAFTTLYLKRGLEAAMLAHFTADFIIWVIGVSFMAR
jgi:membrane protease YdiL (CAAX protease family)